MTKTNINSQINVKIVNRLILSLLLLWILPVVIHIPDEYFLNSNLSESIQSYGVALFVALFIALFRPTVVREFVRDSRFRTVPKWYETLIVIGINYVITLGLLFFFLGSIGLFDSNIGEISKLSDTSNRSPVLPYNRITGTFDLLSGTVNFLAAVIIIPLYEELLYRGLALKAYEKASSPLFAAVFTAILFSLFHLNFVQIIWLLPISFITARAVQVFGSWWIAAIFHAVHNGLIFVLTSLAPVNGGTTENPISFWMGLVGLVSAIVAFGAAIYWFRKREQRSLILERKKEKIFTPSLTIFITVCFLLMFS